MNKRERKQLELGRIVPGQGFIIPTPRFGPMFASQIRLQAEVNRRRLIEFPKIASNNDAIIVRAFEGIRGGLSVDRFLCDPALSRRLRRECKRLGLDAPEPAINLRLLAIRKSSKKGTLKETARPAAARDIVERLGIGVEASMRLMALRFGASVDDMLAHPSIGEAFEENARSIVDGGTSVEYRMCALQIRKGRHISGEYEKAVAALDLRMIERRWESLGSITDAAWKRAPGGPGLVELRIPEQSLYLLRTRQIATTIEDTFTPQSIGRLLRSDYFSNTEPSATSLRYITRKELPKSTPKAWELFLIHEYRPRFNWPVTADADAA